MQTPYQFFREYAGYSYNPATQTAAQGRRECASRLARAERVASKRGYYFDWDIDPETNSSDFSDEPDPWQLYVCRMYDEDGELIGSLHGIDFGRDGSPAGEPYRRVVEAELALDAI